MASSVENLTIDSAFDDWAVPWRDPVIDPYAELGGRSAGDAWPSTGDTWPSVGDLAPDPSLPDDSDGGPITTEKNSKKRSQKFAIKFTEGSVVNQATKLKQLYRLLNFHCTCASTGSPITAKVILKHGFRFMENCYSIEYI